MLSSQENFFTFIKNISGFKNLGEWNSNSLDYIVTKQLDDVSIEIQLLNTAWCSQKNEKPGELFFPTLKFEDNYLDSKNNTIKVLAAHHPFNWLTPECNRKLRAYTEAKFDIVLFGHEHAEDLRTITDQKGKPSNFIDGTVLFGSKDSGFNLISVDINEKEYAYHSFHWKEGAYLIKQDTPVKLQIKQDSRIILISESFRKYLDDPGTKFTHRNCDNIKLNDIFVCPSIKTIEEDENTSFGKTLENTDDIITLFKQNKNNLIVGFEKSGKTAFAKQLFEKYYLTDYFPILVKSNEIFTILPKNIEENLRKFIANQYTGTRIEEKFLEQSKTNGVLIIDSFNSFENIKISRIKEILDVICSYFDSIVILASNDIYLECMKYESVRDVLLKYEQYKILPFSGYKRRLLVEKWTKLGADYPPDRELAAKMVRLEKAIDQSLGRDLVPSYPLFILTILQTLEAITPLSTPNHGTCGSFGYIYESLITTSLISAYGSIDDIETFYNYLSELAYYMYSNSTVKI